MKFLSLTIVLNICFIFLAVHPCVADTDQQTINFLEKLNRYYYCLSYEGLKNYSFEISLNLTDEYKQALPQGEHTQKYIQAFDGFRYSVKGTSTTVPQVTLINNPTIGNEEIDKSIQQLAPVMNQLIQSVMVVWVNNSVGPMHGPINYKWGCAVSKTSDGGFIVTEKMGNTVEKYDGQGKLISIASSSLGGTLETQYVKTAKGYLIHEVNSPTTNDIPGSDTQYEFQTIQNLWLPKNIKFTSGTGFPPQGISVNLNFSNFVLNQ